MGLLFQLDQIEAYKNSLDDIQAALLSLVQTDLPPQQYRALLHPLADHMGNMLASIDEALSQIDKLDDNTLPQA